MSDYIRLMAPIQANYQGHIVPGIITRVYDEQEDDADEAVDVHLFVPTELNVPGNVAALKGLRHAENKANPKAHAFIFLGEDLELLQPKPQEPPPVEEVSEEAQAPIQPLEENTAVVDNGSASAPTKEEKRAAKPKNKK